MRSESHVHARVAIDTHHDETCQVYDTIRGGRAAGQVPACPAFWAGRALAARSGLSANALSMIERGKTSPSVSTLYKLADALGVPITTFFGAQASQDQIVFIKAETRTRVPFQGGLW